MIKVSRRICTNVNATNPPEKDSIFITVGVNGVQWYILFAAMPKF